MGIILPPIWKGKYSRMVMEMLLKWNPVEKNVLFFPLYWVTESGPATYCQEDTEQYALQQPWRSVQIPLRVVSTGEGWGSNRIVAWSFCKTFFSPLFWYVAKAINSWQFLNWIILSSSPGWGTESRFSKPKCLPADIPINHLFVMSLRSRGSSFIVPGLCMVKRTTQSLSSGRTRSRTWSLPHLSSVFCLSGCLLFCSHLWKLQFLHFRNSWAISKSTWFGHGQSLPLKAGLIKK